MRFYSSPLVAIVAAALLASCGATKSAKDYAHLDYIGKGATFVERTSEPTENEKQRWSHLDIVKDSLPGMSVDRAYAELLKGKTGAPVIVAVIDSGIDINHPDMQGRIWVNSKEIPGNGIDDDKNGYIDDINGWNFLGNSNDENLEMTRILKKADDGSKEYAAAKKEYEAELQQAMAGKQQMTMLSGLLTEMKKEIGKDNFTADDLKNKEFSNPMLNQMKAQFAMILEQVELAEIEGQFQEGLKHYTSQMDFHLNKEFNGRAVVGDNPNDINDRNYGDGNVIGPVLSESLHGTHVAGIIAQVRGNGIGGDGVADSNIKIMALRAVPNGDEYDKDIALAIRYAVDNGAKVINGSFGKSYSPNKEWVFDAIKYAASKDVLFVHAAGNDGKDLDKPENTNYPNDAIDDPKVEIADNVLTIGALNPAVGEDLPAGFSNYGTHNVDIFAPGVEIYATAPDNTYRYLQGTSMAGPNAAGVAALIRAYYPKLSASQVKQIIMESGVSLTHEVKLSNDTDQRSFSQASRSGKIVNAYNALLLAAEMAK